MNTETLNDFYCLKSCEAQDLVSEIFCKAISYADQGETVLCSREMQKASRIINFELLIARYESESCLHNADEDAEVTLYNADVNAVKRSSGGCYD